MLREAAEMLPLSPDFLLALREARMKTIHVTTTETFAAALEVAAFVEQVTNINRWKLVDPIHQRLHKVIAKALAGRGATPPAPSPRTEVPEE
jgi:hypothetical protein